MVSVGRIFRRRLSGVWLIVNAGSIQFQKLALPRYRQFFLFVRSLSPALMCAGKPSPMRHASAPWRIAKKSFSIDNLPATMIGACPTATELQSLVDYSQLIQPSMKSRRFSALYPPIEVYCYVIITDNACNAGFAMDLIALTTQRSSDRPLAVPSWHTPLMDGLECRCMISSRPPAHNETATPLFVSCRSL